MKTTKLVLRAAMIGFLIVSFVASGELASLAFGICFLVAAILFVSDGIHAISMEALTVMPDEFGFRQETVSRIKEPIRFWLFVSLKFVLAIGAATYGVYVLAGVLSKQ